MSISRRCYQNSDKEYGSTCIIIISLTYLTSNVAAVGDIASCPSKLDVAFAVDNSYSVGAQNFREILKVVTHFARQMPVAPEYVHIALVQFSQEANVSFFLNEGVTLQALQRLLNGTSYKAGSTQTGLALRALREKVFTADHGDRPNVPNLAVVITDGPSSNPEMLMEESHRLRESGTEIFAIGLGFLTNPTELQILAGSYIFSTDLLDQAYNVTDCLLESVCKRFKSTIGDELTTSPSAKTTLSQTSTIVMPNIFDSDKVYSRRIVSKPATASSLSTTSEPTSYFTLNAHPTSTIDIGSHVPVRQCECYPKTPADIVMMIDSSDAVGAHNFRLSQNFVISLGERLKVIEQSTKRIGVIQYSDDARQAIRLGNFNSSQSFNESIMDLNFTGGGTNAPAALNVLASEVLTTHRQNRFQIGLMLLSSPSKQPNLSRLHASILHHHHHVHLFAIGVGDRISLQELQTIASAPSEDHVFVANNFSSLQSLEAQIVTSLCTVMHSKCPNESGPIVSGRAASDPETSNNQTALVCQDLYANCSDYTEAECSQDVDWFKDNCALTCGFCVELTGKASKSTDELCSDKISNCDAYGTYICTDKTFFHWAVDNCAGYCEFCNETNNYSNISFPHVKESSAEEVNASAQQDGHCKDLIPDCEIYGGPEVCQKFREWSSVRCRAYCGLCQRYVVTDAVEVNGTRCPQWRIPTECSMVTVEWSRCPMPSCPDGYYLTATREE